MDDFVAIIFDALRDGGLNDPRALEQTARAASCNAFASISYASIARRETTAFRPITGFLVTN
jgi:hypothetical protein